MNAVPAPSIPIYGPGLPKSSRSWPPTLFNPASVCVPSLASSKDRGRTLQLQPEVPHYPDPPGREREALSIDIGIHHEVYR